MQDIMQNSSPNADDKKTPLLRTPDALIAWQAMEYAHVPKSTNWYWTMGVGALALTVAGIWMQNFLLVVIVLLAAFSIALFSVRKPDLVNFAVTPRGLRIDDRLFPYEDLESFWIHFDPPHQKEIGILSKKVLMPRLVVPTGDTDPNKIREHLIKFVPEKPHEESISESIARFVGF